MARRRGDHTTDKEDTMNATTILRAHGQRLWLDTISRRLLESGTLQHYIDDFGLTGITSNPTILRRELTEDEHELGPSSSPAMDDDPEVAVYAEAVHDVQRAADMFRPTWDSTQGEDGWVSIEVPPALAYLTTATVHAGKRLHTQVGRPNVFIKVPGTWPGVAAVEALTVAGVPTNATLIFDARQHRAIENGYLRGLERRRRMGLPLSVPSVASIFVSRWDAATNPLLPRSSHNLLGLLVAHDVDWQHRHMLTADRWSRLQEAGATPQRLVWASTSPKDLELEPTYYVARLPLPDTISTMPESTLLALTHAATLASADPSMLAGITKASLARHGIDQGTVADTLQRTGVEAFAADWDQLVASRRPHVRA
jgi:transaldolase